MAGWGIAGLMILGIGALWDTQDDLYMTWDAESDITPMYRAFAACEKDVDRMYIDTYVNVLDDTHNDRMSSN
jgi:hypothetical protein